MKHQKLNSTCLYFDSYEHIHTFVPMDDGVFFFEWIDYVFWRISNVFGRIN